MNKFTIPQELKFILSRFSNSGFTALIVGGSVRDILMNNTPNDYDIATNALPEEVKSLFSELDVIPTGIKHGTVTVIKDSMPFEITTFRTDGEYRDSRHPESIKYSDTFFEDSLRRDFTMNAIGYSSEEGFIDFHGGISDIENKLIRTVGNADKRFGEDALRILRCIRFASTLGFDIEKNTAEAAQRNAHLLKNISAERIRDEIVKLICGKNAGNVLRRYYGILSQIIPEINPLVGFRQNNPHHIYDVLGHTIKAVESIPPTAHLRLAALLHDFGKPQTYSEDENGVGHFYGHTEQSKLIAREILARLKFDNATAERVIKIIRYHDTPIEPDKKSICKYLNKLTPDIFFDLVSMLRADTAALAPEYSSRNARFDMLEQTANEILSNAECFSLASLAINGNDLIAIGIPRGKELGKALNTLLDAVINGDVSNKKAELLQYAQKNIKFR